jgi:diguanylate cyclase (GGDEF)-like protein
VRAYEHSPNTLCFPCDHLRPELSGQLGEYICIPVIAHGDTVGLLHINFAATDKSSVAKALGQFVTRCAEHISLAIAKVKLRDELHDQSIRDPLTGLYNRRYFMDAMRRETVSSDRGEKGFGLISFDADKFKTFSDNHGHEAGNMVLRALAQRMVTVIPDDAICVRIGGEEFAIPLPKTDLYDAFASAERLRRDVEAIEVRTAFGPLPRVTISSGVVTYDVGHPAERFDEASR